MSDPFTSHETPLEPAHAPLAPAPSTLSTPCVADQPTPSVPMTPAPQIPPEAQILLELVTRGLAPYADEQTRAAARELWSRFAQSLCAALPAPLAMPATPVMSAM